MPDANNFATFEKDYILSCATLFSEYGFPKSAFIKMVGTEYASDIFDLTLDGKLIISANNFTYPQRDKRKKRINQEAKYHFYTEMMDSLTQMIILYISSYAEEQQPQSLDNVTASIFLSTFDHCSHNTDIEAKVNKYHKNLGFYICESLIRSVEKIPLNQVDSKKVYNTLGWYFIVIQDLARSKEMFLQADSISCCN